MRRFSLLVLAQTSTSCNRHHPLFFLAVVILLLSSFLEIWGSNFSLSVKITQGNNPTNYQPKISSMISSDTLWQFNFWSSCYTPCQLSRLSVRFIHSIQPHHQVHPTLDRFSHTITHMNAMVFTPFSDAFSQLFITDGRPNVSAATLQSHDNYPSVLHETIPSSTALTWFMKHLLPQEM